MSYSSRPAEAVFSALRSMMYISYCKNRSRNTMCKKMFLLTAFAARGDDLRYLYVEVCRVKGPGSDEPGFGSTGIIRDQLPGSFHQKLTVLLG